MGGLAGGWRALLHAEVSDEFLEQVQRDLTPGNFAVIAEISEEWTAPVDSRMQALGATVVRASRDAYVDDLIAKRAETSRSEFAEWKTKRSGAKAERMEAKLDVVGVNYALIAPGTVVPVSPYFLRSRHSRQQTRRIIQISTGEKRGSSVFATAVQAGVPGGVFEGGGVARGEATCA